uniref:Uncharacterized protein n=1 Tax=Setaria italica TaxID=4555 RepID=K4AK13_SETIT
MGWRRQRNSGVNGSCTSDAMYAPPN